MPRWDANSRKETALVGMIVGVGGTAVAVGVSVGREVGLGVLDGGSGVAVAAGCEALHPTRNIHTRLKNRDENFENKVIPPWLR